MGILQCISTTFVGIIQYSTIQYSNVELQMNGVGMSAASAD